MTSAFQTTRLFAVLFAGADFAFDADQGAALFRFSFPDMNAPAPPRGAMAGPPGEGLPLAFANGDQTCLVEVAPRRVQITQAHPHGGLPLPEGARQFVPFVRRVHSFFAEQGLKVTRLGYIVQLFRHLGESANQRIVEYFFQKNFFGRAEQVQVHVHTRIPIGDVLANRWIRIHPLHTADASRRDTGILVTVDLNSLAEQTYTFSARDIQAFLEKATGHIEEEIDFLHLGELAE